MKNKSTNRAHRKESNEKSNYETKRMQHRVKYLSMKKFKQR